MQKHRFLNTTVLWTLILALLVIVLWIIAAILQTQVSPELSQDQIQPLDPNLNVSVIDSLKTRITFTNEDFNRIPPQRQAKLSNPNQPSTSSATVH